MTARPEFGAAIAVEGVRPAWLPDDVWVSFKARNDFTALSYAPQVCPWENITAIRLEVPRYDFVYLALSKNFTPWLGGDEVPGDWDASKPVLISDGTMTVERYSDPRNWKLNPKGPYSTNFLKIIGYTRKATSSALPLAHPAAPQGEEVSEALRIAVEALRAYAEPTGYADKNDEPYAADEQCHPGKLAELALEQIAALAPAAIASGREGAE